MKKDTFKSCRLRAAVLALLLLPFVVSASTRWEIGVGDEIATISECEVIDGFEHYVGYFDVSQPTDGITITFWANGGGWKRPCMVGSALSLSETTALTFVNADAVTTFTEPLAPGRYNVEITYQVSWPYASYITVTKNDGSINEFAYSFDGEEWTKAKAENFTLFRHYFDAGGTLYLRQTYKAKDGEGEDPDTYTYYYGGTITGLTDNETGNFNLKGSPECVPLVFEEASKYTIDAVTQSEFKRTAVVTATRIGFMPILKSETLSYRLASGANADAGGKLSQGDVLLFSVKGTDENGVEQDYELYPTEPVEFIHGKDQKITLSTNTRYKGNTLTSFYDGTFTQQNVALVHDDTELTLTYTYWIGGSENGTNDIPHIALFDIDAKPAENKTCLDPTDAKKTVPLRYEGNLTYSCFITLTQEDIENRAIAMSDKKSWQYGMGHTYPTGTNNVILKGEQSFMAFPAPNGSGLTTNGLLRFGSRFTPGTYRVEIKATGYKESTPSLDLPFTIVLKPVNTVYYHVDQTQWRESVGVGILRKFGYDEGEEGIRSEYNSKNVYLRADRVGDDGSVTSTYYTGTVDFPEEGVNTIKKFKLDPYTGADPETNAKIAVNGKGQFMMSFDADTEVLTVTRTAVFPVPVRAAVSVGGSSERTIIPVGGKLLVHVTEPNTAIHFSANYDMRLTPTNGIEDPLDKEYAAWIHPADGNITLGNNDYEYHSFVRSGAHTGTVTAVNPGYYTFNARVYPKQNRVLIACEYTTYNPEMMLSTNFDNAAFAKYPYVTSKPQAVIKAKDGSSTGIYVKLMTSYVLRGDALDYHNEYYKDKPEMQLDPLVPYVADKYNVKYRYDYKTGEKLAEIGSYERGELVRGNRYKLEAVVDLFGRGGIIGINEGVKDTNGNITSGNFVNLVNLRKAGQARAQGRLEAEGGRVTFVVQFASSDNAVRMGYFYVTPKMQQRIRQQYENSGMVHVLNGYSSFEGIGDDESKPDYEDGLFTKCLIAALNDGVIPGFAVLGDVTNRGAVRYLDSQLLNKGKDEYYVEGSAKDLGNLFQTPEKMPYYYKDRCWIEGSRIPLSFFGDDYRGEMSEDFPEGTYIYPYIISSGSGSGDLNSKASHESRYALPLGSPTMENCDFSFAKVKFSDNRLNLLANQNGSTYREADLNNEYADALIHEVGNYGCPAAITFNYRTKNLKGEPIYMTIVGWEDDYDNTTNASNWQDIVMNVDGVKPVFNKPVSFVDFDVDACPVANDQGNSNYYRHIVSLKPKAVAVGNGEWTMHQFGTPYAKQEDDGSWTVVPAYSYIDVKRDGEFIGQIVFIKDICRTMMRSKLAENSEYIPTDDAELHTSLRYFFSKERLMSIAGKNIGFMDGVTPVAYDDARWIEVFHDARGNGDNPVDISRVRFSDEFSHDFGDTGHAYEGSLYSASTILDSDPDEVLVPGSALTASVKAVNKLPEEEKMVTDVLPEVLTADNGEPAVVVARNLNLADKEVITSYSIFEDGAAADAVAVATVTAIRSAKDDAGVITATAWMQNGTECKVKHIDDDKDMVYLDGTGITGGKIYTVVVNTEVTVAQPDDYTLSCDFGDVGKSKFEGSIPSTNSYGAKPATVDDISSALTLSVESPRTGILRKLDGKPAVTYATAPSWTIDLSRFPGVEPGDVKYYLWRQYKDGTPAYESTDNGSYLSSLFANEPMPGQIPLSTYQSWAWAPQNLELVAEGNAASINDVLVVDYEDTMQQQLEVEYTLYAYIPANEDGDPAVVKTSGYGEQTANTRYYVATQKATVTANEVETEVTTGVDDAFAGSDNISISGANGVLRVTGAVQVSVYNLSGVEVYAAEGDVVTELSAGIYVVKADSKVVKIRL